MELMSHPGLAHDVLSCQTSSTVTVRTGQKGDKFPNNGKGSSQADIATAEGRPIKQPGSCIISSVAAQDLYGNMGQRGADSASGMIV